MRIKWLVAAALILGASAATVSFAMPSEPGPARDRGALRAGEGIPPELEALYAEHPIEQSLLDAALARPERRLPRRLDAGQRAQGLDDTVQWEVDHFDNVATLDPMLWISVSDLNDVSGRISWGEYFPTVSRCRFTTPTQSMWLFGGGLDGSKLACSDNYPSGANASAIMLLDMTTMFSSPPAELKMQFDYWLNLRIFEEGGVVPDGLFVNLVLPRDDLPVPERVTIARITSEFEERFFDDPKAVDLLAAQDLFNSEREPINIYDLGVAFIEFLALTQRPSVDNPTPSTLPGGIFVDTIDLVSDLEPMLPPGTQTGGITATPLPPTDTPTPSATPTPSVTPTGKPATDTPETPDTPTPSETPDHTGGGTIYLPIGVQAAELGEMP